MSEMMDESMDMLDEDAEELDEEADQEVDKILWDLTEGKLGQAGKVGSELPVRLLTLCSYFEYLADTRTAICRTRRRGAGGRRCRDGKDAGPAR